MRQVLSRSFRMLFQNLQRLNLSEEVLKFWSVLQGVMPTMDARLDASIVLERLAKDMSKLRSQERHNLQHIIYHMYI